MKAIVYQQYGSPEVLQFQEIEKPAPKEHEVLIKIEAASINSWDWDILRGSPFLFRIVGGGIFKPKNQILGIDIAGRVEAVGEKVTDFKIGDEVFGDISEQGWGGFAAYVCVDPKSLALKSPKMSFEEAASLPHTGVLALQGLRHHKIEAGQQVLINGAGGGVGAIAIQLAKLKGAKVTAVDRADKLEMLIALGADHVIDYTLENFTKNGKQYDVILDMVAFNSVFDYKNALTSSGTYVMVGGSMGLLLPLLFWGKVFSIFGKKKIGFLAHQPKREDLEYLNGLFEEGKLRPVVDRVFSLKEVPKALQYLGDGNSKGKLIISMP